MQEISLAVLQTSDGMRFPVILKTAELHKNCQKLKKVTCNTSVTVGPGMTACVSCSVPGCARQTLCVPVHSICLCALDCRDSILCCMCNLIRMNFSENPLLARVDHRGKTKTGLSFITFLLQQYSSCLKFRFHFYYCLQWETAFLNR